jgi:hypothetical protein
MNVHSIVLNPMLNIPACTQGFSICPTRGESLLREPHHKKEVPEGEPVSTLMSEQRCEERSKIEYNSTPPSLP